MGFSAKIFSRLGDMHVFLAGMSFLALAAAYTGQYGFGLRPCDLCLFQRVPYALVCFAGLIGAGLAPRRRGASLGLMGFNALAFFANAGIAFYHTGVEQKWWRSFLEGCSVPDLSGNIEEVVRRLQAAPPVRCDEIAWADPLFGLSMANWNVIACILLGLIAVKALWYGRKA